MHDNHRSRRLSRHHRPPRRSAAFALLIALALLLVADGAARLCPSAHAASRAPTSASANHRFGLFPTRGNGALALVRHDVQVNVSHPLAEVVVTQEFENPTARQLEAYYYYPLPRQATVSGLSLWVNGKRRRARVLERQRAREIYQGIVRQKRDPALVERLSGNLFRIRIFPILPRRRHRVQLRFVVPVSATARGRYRLALPRPPGRRVDVLRLGVRLQAPFAIGRAHVSGYGDAVRALQREAGVLRLAMPAATTPFTRDIALDYWPGRLPARARAHATWTRLAPSGERLFVAELPLPRRVAGPRAPRKVVLLLDRSRSMSAHAAAARRFARALVSRLAPRDRVAVVPFDLLPDASALAAGPRRVDDRARQQALRAVDRVYPPSAASSSRPGLGTAFLPAFHAALAASPTHVVCVTDGGDRFHRRELERLMRKLYDRRDVRVSLVGMGKLPNAEPMRDLARVSGGVFDNRAERTAPDDAALARRLLAQRARVAATVTPAGDTNAPAEQLDVVLRDPWRVLVAGRLRGAAASASRVTIALSTGTRYALAFAPRPTAASRRGGASTGTSLDAGAISPRLTRTTWAMARIDALMQRIKLFGERSALIDRVIRLSKAYGVVSEYTALLVTETDADYNRPTSGRRWQRTLPRIKAPASPTFHSTPEPHEWAMILLGMALLLWARKRGWLARRVR